MSTENVITVRLVLIRSVCVEEFWSVAAILGLQRAFKSKYFGIAVRDEKRENMG